MSGVTGRWVGGNPFTGRLYEELRQEMMNRAQAALDAVIERAVDAAKRFTAERPGRTTGKSGRIETGLMIRSIVGRVVRKDAETIAGQFGFLDRHELYFAIQTVLGSTHGIRPTLAIRDAVLIAMKDLNNEMSK